MERLHRDMRHREGEERRTEVERTEERHSGKKQKLGGGGPRKGEMGNKAKKCQRMGRDGGDREGDMEENTSHRAHSRVSKLAYMTCNTMGSLVVN